MKNIFGVWFIATLFFTSVSIAQIRNVPSQYATIQAAINDCNDGDEVIISSGTYTGTGNRDIDFIGKAITVRGATGNPNDVIIDCNGGPSEPHRGFIFQTGEAANSILDGVTVTNGFTLSCGGEGGAGISITNSSPTIQNCVITACDTEVIPNCLGFCVGGGIYIEEGGPAISNCVISGNTIGEFGRGGAGLYLVSEKDVSIRNCVISGNRTTAYGYGSGGGISKAGSGILTITNCTIADNVAFERGGGIAGSNIRILNSIIWNNMASEGPQIFLSDLPPSGNIVINYSDIQGGWTGLGNIEVDPCFVNPPTVLTADFDSSGEVDFHDFAEFAAKWQSFEAGYKYDISIPADGVINELDLLVFANQWLSSADLAGSDYHLQSKGGQWDIETGQLVFGTANSRCIDAGMPGMSLGNEPLVFKDNVYSGNLRINMGAYGGTAQASMGHYSNWTTWSRLCDATNDGIVDFSDFAVVANDFGLEDTENPLPADFDRDGHVGLSDIVKIAQDWLETTTWY